MCSLTKFIPELIEQKTKPMTLNSITPNEHRQNTTRNEYHTRGVQSL